MDAMPTDYGMSESASAVLVIEDDPRDRALIIQTLTRAGYGVQAVATGRQAIVSCTERVFDAITLDLLLPDMTGLDVLHRIRLDGLNQHTPVVVVSVVAERGMMAGFSVQDYLTKPVNGRDLLQAFQQARVPARRGSKILIVDDDPAAQRLMAATLKDLGYDIHVSSGGEDALTFAAVEQPLAVVLDLVMPGVDGLEFLSRFRDLAANRAVPVIVWTMKELTSADHKRLRALAQGIVEKNNWRPATFVNEIRALINPAGGAGVSGGPVSGTLSAGPVSGVSGRSVSAASVSAASAAAGAATPVSGSPEPAGSEAANPEVAGPVPPRASNEVA
jgi:CheY-like chemotaxis protein